MEEGATLKAIEKALKSLSVYSAVPPGVRPHKAGQRTTTGAL